MALGLWSQGSLEVRSKTWVLTARQPRNGQLYEYTLQQGYLQGRTVRVFIPPGYADSRQGFNAVYFHDGQMLFDSTTTWNHQSWNLTEATAFEGKYQDKVLIGIDNFPEKRYAEFFPSPIFNQLSPDLQTRLKDSLWGENLCLIAMHKPLSTTFFPLLKAIGGLKRAEGIGPWLDRVWVPLYRLPSCYRIPKKLRVLLAFLYIFPSSTFGNLRID